MKLSMAELDKGMMDALQKVKSGVGSVVDKIKPKPSSDDQMKNMLGSGTASQAAGQIINRKKQIDEAAGL